MLVTNSKSDMKTDSSGSNNFSALMQYSCKKCGYPCFVTTSYTDDNPNLLFYVCKCIKNESIFRTWCVVENMKSMHKK
jgi:hypothetical protein